MSQPFKNFLSDNFYEYDPASLLRSCQKSKSFLISPWSMITQLQVKNADLAEVHKHETPHQQVSEEIKSRER